MIPIETLRAAGLSDEQIVRVLETDQRERAAKEREQNRIRQRNYRARNAAKRDAVTEITEVTRDGVKRYPVEQVPRAVSKESKKASTHSEVSNDTSSFVENAQPAEEANTGEENKLYRSMRYGRATRLTYDWQPTDANLQYAVDKGLSDAAIAIEVERFRNYFVAKAGVDGLCRDWSRRWQNWILNELKWNGGRHGTGRRHGSLLDAFDRLQERFTEAGATGDYIPGSSGPKPLGVDQQTGSLDLLSLPKR